MILTSANAQNIIKSGDRLIQFIEVSVMSVVYQYDDKYVLDRCHNVILYRRVYGPYSIRQLSIWNIPVRAEYQKSF